VSRLGGVPPAVGRKAWIVALVGAGVVVSAAVGLLPVLSAALVGALVLVMSGVLTPSEAKGAIDLDVILVIAGAFGLAAALENSGLAADVAQLIGGVFGPLGASGGLAGIVLTTVLLKSLITNNAAAVLMFPIAMSAATELGLNARAFAVAVALAASASFLTPLSYQTNLMVYGPGGYRFGDFARLGAPLVILVALATIVLVPWFWPLY
jgi:di/tricarboxylate transporter